MKEGVGECLKDLNPLFHLIVEELIFCFEELIFCYKKEMIIAIAYIKLLSAYQVLCSNISSAVCKRGLH